MNMLILALVLALLSIAIILINRRTPPSGKTGGCAPSDPLRHACGATPPPQGEAHLCGTSPQGGRQEHAATERSECRRSSQGELQIARETVRQQHQNFLHYDGSPQPPIDPYQTAHHAVR